MYTGVLSKWVLTKLLGKSLNDWVISMLLYEKYLMLSVFFPIITSQIMPLTFKIVHPVSTSTVRLSVLCWQLSSISILLLICPTIIQLLINYVLCQKNRSTMRTWGLMLYASMLLFISVGILFSNVSIWEFDCCK